MGISKGMMMAMFLVLDGFGQNAGVVGTGFGIVTRSGETFLVTNQHVARRATKEWTEHIHIKIFTLGYEKEDGDKGAIQGMAIPTALIAVTTREEETKDGWDLAVISLAFHQAGSTGLETHQTFLNWEIRVEKSEIANNAWWEGTPVLTMGYPEGIGWKDKLGNPVWPTVRSGVVARMQEWLSGKEEYFMTDTATLGGQSGSPVFLRPYKEQRSLLLAGVTYARRRTAVRNRAGEITGFTDAHLQYVIPIQHVEKLMNKARRKKKEWVRTLGQ